MWINIDRQLIDITGVSIAPFSNNRYAFYRSNSPIGSSDYFYISSSESARRAYEWLRDNHCVKTFTEDSDSVDRDCYTEEFGGNCCSCHGIGFNPSSGESCNACAGTGYTD